MHPSTEEQQSLQAIERSEMDSPPGLPEGWRRRPPSKGPQPEGAAFPIRRRSRISSSHPVIRFFVSEFFNSLLTLMRTRQLLAQIGRAQRMQRNGPGSAERAGEGVAVGIDVEIPLSAVGLPAMADKPSCEGQAEL